MEKSDKEQKIKKDTSNKAKSSKFAVWKKDLKNNPKKKWAFIVIILFVVIAILAYINANLFVAATVNGKIITRYALVKELEKQGGKQVLDQLVTQELINQKANEKGIVVTQEDLDYEIAIIEKSLEEQGTDLDTMLMLQGQARSDLEKSLKLKVMVRKLLEGEIEVTEEEARAAYEENIEFYGEDAVYEEIKQQIKNDLIDQKINQKYQEWLQQVTAESTVNTLVVFK